MHASPDYLCKSIEMGFNSKNDPCIFISAFESKIEYEVLEKQCLSLNQPGPRIKRKTIK